MFNNIFDNTREIETETNYPVELVAWLNKRKRDKKFGTKKPLFTKITAKELDNKIIEINVNYKYDSFYGFSYMFNFLLTDFPADIYKLVGGRFNHASGIVLKVKLKK